MLSPERGHHRADRLKPQSQTTGHSDYMDHSFSNSMKLIHAVRGQDALVIVERSDRMWSTGEGNGKPLQYSCLITPWTVWKGKKIGHWKMNSPGQYVPNMLLEISWKITPERMKGWSQSKNSAKLWMWLVMEVKTDAIKSNIAWGLRMLGPWIFQR